MVSNFAGRNIFLDPHSYCPLEGKRIKYSNLDSLKKREELLFRYLDIKKNDLECDNLHCIDKEFFTVFSKLFARISSDENNKRFLRFHDEKR